MVLQIMTCSSFWILIDYFKNKNKAPTAQRKRQRLRPGTKALREIRRFQKSVDLLIPRMSFIREVSYMSVSVVFLWLCLLWTCLQNLWCAVEWCWCWGCRKYASSYYSWYKRFKRDSIRLYWIELDVMNFKCHLHKSFFVC